MPIGIYIKTKEHCENISKARKGMKFSLETRRKISESHKGINTWMKGRHLSEETKKKISEARKNCIPWNTGKKLSKEHIKKVMRRRIPTSLEEKFQKIMDKYGLPYKYVGNGDFILGNCNPDFINTNDEKIAIEVYARFYKQLNGRDIDQWKKERTKTFTEYGWDIIFFDETQVNENYVLSQLGEK